jgi:hypothetical protein
MVAARWMTSLRVIDTYFSSSFLLWPGTGRGEADRSG